MKVQAAPLALPAVAAIACGSFMSVDTWEQLRTAIIPGISVVAAAVLVRLARGLPFTNADHFTLAQFRDVRAKLEGNAGKLRMLIFISMTSIVSLIAAPLVLGMVRRATASGLITGLADSALSALTASAVAYSFVRVIEVVQSDVGLLKLQGKIIEGAITRKNAATFEKQVEDAPKPGIAGSSSFGRPLQ